MTANDLIYKSIHIITEYYNNNLQPYFLSVTLAINAIIELIIPATIKSQRFLRSREDVLP